MYSKDIDRADIITVGWGWKLRDIDRKTYAAIKDSSIKRNLIDSIRSACDSKGLIISVEPNENNLEAIRVYKELKLEGLTKDLFVKTLKDVVVMLAFLMNEFEKIICLGLVSIR